MIALYLIPFIGFIVYKLLGFLALGVVVYTIILAYRKDAPVAPSPQPANVAGVAAPAFTDAQSAAAAGSAFAGGAFASGASGAAAGFESAPPPPAEPIITDATTLPRAGFWVRMGALFIDIVLIGVSISLLHDGDWLLLLLATYGAVMWKLRGTTVGGIVFGLKVVRLDGRPIDWATAIVRALGCFLSMVVAGLGFIWIVFDDERQAWHDKIAGTVVVRVPKGVSLV